MIKCNRVSNIIHSLLINEPHPYHRYLCTDIKYKITTYKKEHHFTYVELNINSQLW